MNKRTSAATIACMLAAAPATSAFARDPMVPDLVTALSGTPLGEDVAGMVGVTELDISVNIFMAIEAEGGVTDKDADGQITYADILFTVNDTIARAMGDVDADGRVQVDDRLAVEAAAGEPGVADVNFDAMVNEADTAVVEEQEGVVVTEEIPDEAVLLVADTYVLLSQLTPEQFAVVLLPGDGDEWPWELPPHVETISTGRPAWPEHVVGHSQEWPRNHLWSITRGWEGDDPYEPEHDRGVSRRHWPPNHTITITQSWEPAHNKEFTIWELGHDGPGWHEVALSRRWENAPNHYAVLSLQWPDENDPSPEVHNLDVSDRWPPNHLKDKSKSKDPSDHYWILSETHGHLVDTSGPVHGTKLSKLWPPNHYYDLSDNWPDGHMLQKSSGWPTGHVKELSNGWPTGKPDWPPNHYIVDSERWDEPNIDGIVPRWPVVPEPDKHNWITTGQILEGFIPSLPDPE